MAKTKRNRRRSSTLSKTPTVFRVFKTGYREVIALFPGEPATCHDRSIVSYMHVGQHGNADYATVVSRTRPAKPEEYAPLARELRAIGYKPSVVRSRTAATTRSYRKNFTALCLSNK